MAIFKLHPSSTETNQWGTQGGGDAHAELSDVNDNTAIQTQYISRECIVQLDDYTAGGTIDSIKHYIRGYKFNTRSGTTDVQVKLENSSGTALYSENHSLAFNSYVAQDFFGTGRTDDGSDDWNTTSLNGLRLHINTDPEDPPAYSYARVVKAYVEVTYTAAAVTDNATFFGANF